MRKMHDENSPGLAETLQRRTKAAVLPPPRAWANRHCWSHRLGLLRLLALYAAFRLVHGLVESDTRGPSFSGASLALGLAGSFLLSARKRRDVCELGSVFIAVTMMLLDVLGVMLSENDILQRSWLTRTAVFWSLSAVGFAWRPCFTGLFEVLTLACHAGAIAYLQQTQAFDGRGFLDELLVFPFFALAGFIAALHFNWLLVDLYLAERAALGEAEAYSKLICMVCDFDMMVSETQKSPAQITRGAESLEKALGQDVSDGAQLEDVVCEYYRDDFQRTLATADALVPVLLSTRLRGAGSKEMNAHLLIVRMPDAGATEYFAESSRGSFLLAARLEAAETPSAAPSPPPPSEQLPLVYRYPKDYSELISEEILDTARRESTATTATGVLFGDVEISHTGLKTLVDLGRKEHWLIDADHVQLHATTVLGSGGFGIVCEGTLCGAAVAIKFPRKSTKNSTSQTPNTRDHVLIMNYLTELRLLRYVRHPNIVAFYGATVDVDNLEMILIFEKMEGSTLSKYIESEKPPETKRLHVLLDVAKALVYLHGLLPAVVHGDLKGENIFVDTTRERLVAKLGDFGLARKNTSIARGMGGTLRWCAPEVLSGQQPPSTAADAYSFGQLAYFAVSGTIPMIELKRHEITSALARGYAPNEVWPTDYFSTRIREISEACRKLDPEARMSMKEVWHELGRVEEPGKPKRGIRSWLGGSKALVPGEEMVHPFGILPAPSELPPAPAGEPPRPGGDGTGHLEAQLASARRHVLGRHAC